MDTQHEIPCKENIRREARQWVLRMNSDTPLRQADIDAMRAWKNRSPAHKAELQRAGDSWCDADILTELAVPFGSSVRKRRRRPLVLNLVSLYSFSPMRAVSMLLIVSVVALLSLHYRLQTDTVGNGVYYTAIGEQKTITLEDRSKIQLDTHSRVSIDYRSSARHLTLLQGKAHFSVADDPTRPFEVLVGSGMVRAVGTAFSVYLDGPDIEVIVDEGRVDLGRIPPTAPNAAGDQTSTSAATINQPLSPRPVFLSLQQGQGARFNQRHQTLSEYTTKDLSRALAWRKGVLIFKGEPLSKVVEDVSRYANTRIDIKDPQLKNLAVTGRFRVGELAALFNVLEMGFGVKVSYISKDHVQLSSVSN